VKERTPVIYLKDSIIMQDTTGVFNHKERILFLYYC